jgi:predicted dienelactone hydrolase
MEAGSDTAEPVPALAMYPAYGEERLLPFGPYTVAAAPDAPIAAGRFPLVVISHGSGGSHLTHRQLARHLVLAGFVVLLPEHPRNNRLDNTLANTEAILASRPRHLRAVIDAAYADAELNAAIVPDSAFVIGHSLGGYTGLALAGGTPTTFASERADGMPSIVPVEPDARVRALVLLAPATGWFMAAGALSNVHVPILMLSAEHDMLTPAGHGAIVRGGVPDSARVEHHVVPNAGHYSFLSPFPLQMHNPSFPPSQDPPGFDREAFHVGMYTQVTDFLRRVS